MFETENYFIEIHEFTVNKLDKNVMTRSFKGKLTFAESMAKHCSWHAGGKARQYYEPVDCDDLANFLSTIDENEAVLWLGLGSNLLVRDGGFDGTVISLKGVFNDLEIMDSNIIRVGSGIPCAKVARFTAKAGLTDAEFLAGIPGTMGGALAMNAGAFGYETWDIVKSVLTIDRKGNQRIWDRNEVDTGYRHTSFDHDVCFVSADLELTTDIEKKAEGKIKNLLGKRTKTQPMGQPSCGSVFRNPAGHYAARLIESCNLKGKRHGGAIVSDKHANFIINEGNATALDIESLIDEVKSTIKKVHKIDLITEVKIVGNK